jgi:hypothetical protein
MNASSVAYRCVLAATALNGLLAGETVDRFIFGRSAWKRLGVEAWARYSREADLTVRGAMVYPSEAIGGSLLSIAAALSVLRHRGRPNEAVAPLAAAAALSTVGLLVTAKAAPYMLRVGRPGDDARALRGAFGGFFRWSALRGACQVLAFGANLWSLSRLCGDRAGRRKPSIFRS